MTYSFPKTQLSNNNLDFQNYYNGSSAFANQNQMTGNAMMGSPIMNGSPYSRQDSESSPTRNHHTLLAMNAYNTLSKNVPMMQSVSPMMVSPDAVMMSNGMNSPYQAPRSPMPFSLGSHGNIGFGNMFDATPAMQVPGMNNAVDNYFEKQNQLMSRILKDVEDYKKVEYLKQRAILEQQLGNLEELDMIAHNLHAQSKSQAQQQLFSLPQARNPYRSLSYAPEYNRALQRKLPTGAQVTDSDFDDFFQPKRGTNLTKAVSPESGNLLKPKKHPMLIPALDSESDFDVTRYPVKRLLVPDDESVDLSVPIRNPNRALKKPIIIPPKTPPKATDSNRLLKSSIDEHMKDTRLQVASPFKKNILETIEAPNKLEDSPLRSAREKLSKLSNLQKAMPISERPAPRRANRTRGKQLLRIFGWAMATPGLWWMSVTKWAEQRLKNELGDMSELVPVNLERFLEFAAKEVENEVKKFVTEKKSMVLVLQPGTKKKPDMNKRCVLISKGLTKILDTLTVQLANGKLNEKFFQFLASISGEDSVTSEALVSGFELERLSFNLFGNLKKMDPWRSKMILATFTLLKGFLNFLLLRPWTVIPSIQQQNVNMPNLINAGSVFYHIVLEVIEDNVPKVTREEPRPLFKAQKPDFSAVDPENLKDLGVIPNNNENDEYEVVSGFYTKIQLDPFLEFRYDLVKVVKESVSDFLGELYKITSRYYQVKKDIKTGLRSDMTK